MRVQRVRGQGRGQTHTRAREGADVGGGGWATQAWPPKIKAFALLPNPALAMPHVWLDVTSIANVAKKVRLDRRPWAAASCSSGV